MAEKVNSIKISAVKRSELDEADRIFRLAFGTFIGLPDPMSFAGDAQMVKARWGAPNVKFLAARDNGRLIGTNLLTTWGSFGFFGPLTILPEYWNRGVAQRLLEATVKLYDEQGVKRTGLFTFPHSTKHIGLYQKFGYWPAYLTALMSLASDSAQPVQSVGAVSLSSLSKSAREEAIEACHKLTNRIERGLDLSDEIRWLLKQGLGEVLIISTRKRLDAFAICHHGPGSEGGTKACYVKFAAARDGAAFDRLLDACIEYAFARGVPVQTGVNYMREDAVRRMHDRGFRPRNQGVAMLRPHTAGHNRPDVYVLDDWR